VLLSPASKLAFAIDAWVALIFIMELTIILFLTKKKTQQKRFRPIILGLHDYISTCTTNNSDTIPHHSWFPFSLELTIEHKPSYNFHSFDIFQHHFQLFPSKNDRL
jgi:hypothetical protein